MTTTVDRFGEGLARRVSRRSALSGAAKLTFASATSWAAFGMLASQRAYANSCQSTDPDCNCDPPGGKYCNLSTQCNSGGCKSPCTFYKAYYPSTACWCTKQCCNYNNAYKGYYKCCDCKCGSTICGCAYYIATCSCGHPACCGGC